MPDQTLLRNIQRPPPAAMDDYADLKFLVVDDNAFVRGIVQSMLLKNRARHIKHAANGREALAALLAQPCDCIISDWNMSPVGGLELLRTVRSGKAPQTPADTCFILLTGHADANVVNIAINLDVNGYLVKPVSFEKLSASIAGGLQRKWQLRGPKYYESISGMEI